MLKRITLLFLAILLIIAAQFGVKRAMAFSDYEEEPASKLTISGWTVTLQEPLIDEVTGNWIWHYTITDPTGGVDNVKGLNYVAMLLPDCSQQVQGITIDTISGYTTVFEVGEGNPHGFGQYNMQAFVAMGTPSSSTIWSFTANTNKATTSTILLDTAGKQGEGELTFEMAVPGCDAPPTGPITQSAQEFTYVNDAGETYTVTVYKNSNGTIDRIIRRTYDSNGNLIDETDITAEGISVTQIQAKYDDNHIEFFDFVPDDTVTKTGDNSTCGYWYNGVFWNFCY